MGKIVVGVDVSPSSTAALAWAADYARLTGDTLVAGQPRIVRRPRERRRR